MIPSLKLTASLPLKMDGWNTSLSYWGPGLFSGATLVSGRVYHDMVDTVGVRNFFPAGFLVSLN